MDALTPKKIGSLCASVVIIVCVVMLSGCGKDSEPTEQGHELPSTSSALAPAPAADAAPTPVSGDSPAAAAAPDPQPAAAEEPQAVEPPDSYNVTCYSGSTMIFRIKTSNDNFEVGADHWTFKNIAPDGHVAYVGGTCLAEQE